MSSALFALVAAALAQADLPADLVEIDAMNAKRDDPVVSKKLDSAVRQALLRYPDDAEVWIRGSRYLSWLADGAETNGKKKRLAKEAWDLAEKAAAKLPDNPRARYSAAVALGTYSQAVGVVQALVEEHEGKFNQHLDFAIANDPSLDFGGPWTVKGRYHFELPWPKRDLKKSVDYYRRALEKYPDNLRALLYLAEAQHKTEGAAKAVETLERALAGSVDNDPPEGRRIQARAAKLLEQWKEGRGL